MSFDKDTVAETEGPFDMPLVLVVDDEPSGSRILYEVLKADYEVCVATSGEDALSFCATRFPDLVLLDVNLPNMDGYEVCRRLKALPATREIPIVFVTAQSNPLEEVRALNEGAADFVSKPFHEQVVKARVRTQITLKFQEEKLRELAMTDGLTGLLNRRRFDQALEEEWRRAIRDRSPLSLLMLDVDHFKAFNDRYGHPAGDHCLQTIAAAIKPLARRPGDLVARYGGEEMVILLPRADEGVAQRLAEFARASIEDLAIPHLGNAEGAGVVTASIGVATRRPRESSGDGPQHLLSAADEMLYDAKRAGRNRVIAATSRSRSAIAAIPPDEEARVMAVGAYRAAHVGRRAEFLDEIARLAAKLLATPIGLVSLVGRDEQVFIGRFGVEAEGTPRDVSFCAHALNGDVPLVVPNATTDPRFKDNPLVAGDLGIRFYAGAPLMSAADGPHMGALCVIDHVPRVPLGAEQKLRLAMLASLAMSYIERHYA